MLTVSLSRRSVLPRVAELPAGLKLPRDGAGPDVGRFSS